MLQKFKAVVLLGVHAENMQSLPEEEAIYVSCVFSLLCPPPIPFCGYFRLMSLICYWPQQPGEYLLFVASQCSSLRSSLFPHPNRLRQMAALPESDSA